MQQNSQPSSTFVFPYHSLECMFDANFVFHFLAVLHFKKRNQCNKHLSWNKHNKQTRRWLRCRR